MKIHAQDDPHDEVAPDAGAGLRFALVASEFNAPVVDALTEGARVWLLTHGVAAEDIEVVRVPGAWELPLAADLLASTGEYDGIVALGCVIRGGTPHFEFVAAGAVDGLQRVSLDHSLPIGLGVLTTDTEAQARDRAGGSAGNKGEEAAAATLHMAVLRAGID